MIVLTGSNQFGNIIHLIVGPESETYMDLHGSVCTLLTPFLEQLDLKRPTMIHLTKCSSESDLSQTIAHLLRNGMRYPFLPPSPGFIKTEDPPKDISAQPAGEPVSEEFKPVSGKCHYCGNVTTLIPKMTPGICFSCAKINLGLNTHKPQTRTPRKQIGPGTRLPNPDLDLGLGEETTGKGSRK